MAVRSHGGDGDATQNPFINNDPVQGVNHKVLDQWETWFTKMDNNGIVIFFIFYDDGVSIWGLDSSDNLRAKEENFIQALVDRFKHHKHLIWVVAEEYEEMDLGKFYTNPNSRLHVSKIAEYHPEATGVTARKNSWAIAMGGAYVMHLEWDIENNSLSDLRDCGRLVSFMESTNFNEMSPHNKLKYADTEYVLAVPGSSYIAYTSSSSSGKIGLQNMAEGIYDFRWFSPENGTTVIETDISAAAGTNSWPKPPRIGAEVAVYIERTGPNPSPPHASPVTLFKDSSAVNK
jgi:hypothetical protein